MKPTKKTKPSKKNTQVILNPIKVPPLRDQAFVESLVRVIKGK